MDPAMSLNFLMTNSAIDSSGDTGEIENIFNKNSTVSVKLRKLGNQLYYKKNHNKDIHKNILLQYSKSIAFAPTDSGDELALAYSNRSALLLHVQQYEKCLVDINKALQITKSPDLKSKLEVRKKKCLDAMTNSNKLANLNKAVKNIRFDQNEQLEKKDSLRNKNYSSSKLPSFTSSKIIPSASEAVAISCNEKYGRHLIATRYIKPGEIIVVERNYVCFPNINQRHLICSHCLKFTWNGIPCDCCAFVIYCSESCKKDAWEEYHDIECKSLPFIPLVLSDSQELVPDMIVALRLLIKAIKKEGLDAVVNEALTSDSENSNEVDRLLVNGKLYSDKFRSCINLLDHSENQKENSGTGSVFSKASKIIKTLLNYTDLFSSKEKQNDNTKLITKTIPQLENILCKLSGIIIINSFRHQAFFCKCKSIMECTMSNCGSIHGVVLNPICSLINHSCNSNVGGIFLPGKTVFFAIAPINKGEQLFGSYGPLFTVEKEDRQMQLQNKFHFSCECQVCEENWPSNPEIVRLDEKLEDSIMIKLFQEFKKKFPCASEDSAAFGNGEDECKFDEETLKHSAKLSELTYKYFDNSMLAAFYNLQNRYNIIKAFDALYGQNYVVSNLC